MLTALLLLLFVAALFVCHVRRNIGRGPGPADIARFESSTNYVNGRFTNRHETIITNETPVAEVKRLRFASLLKFLAGREGNPDKTLPVVQLTRNDFPDPPADYRVTWLGHATLLIELGGARILVDPIFGNASPIPGLVQRFAAPPISRAQLPHIDLILISHDHYDHLEIDTIRHFRNRGTPFLVPLGVGARLRGFGIPDDRITELDWFQTVTHSGLDFTAAPTHHRSGRSFSDSRATLWCAWIIASKNKKIFFGGDGGYDADFQLLGDRYGPFDFAALGIGAYDPRWAANHLFPEEAIRATRELRAARLLPIHWATYSLAPHPWDEPILRAIDAATKENLPLLTPKMGEPIIPGQTPTSAWW